MTENPYEILDVSPSATPEEIKKAYRKKARENHPDLNPGDKDAEARMNKINEAYDRLTNPEKYAASDARRRAQSGYGTQSSGGSASNGASGGSAGAGSAYNNPYNTGQGASGYSSYGGGQNTTEQNPYGWTTVNFDDLFGGGFGSTHAGPIHPEPSAADSPQIRQAISWINSGSYKSAIEIMQKIPSTGRNARWYYLFALANNGAGNTVAAHDNIARARQLDPNNSDYMRAENAFKQRAQTYRTTGEGRGFTSFGIDPNWICCCICLGPTCLSYANRLCLMPGMWN